MSSDDNSNVSKFSIDVPEATPKKSPDYPFNPYIDEKNGVVREVGGQAIWSVSSCKPGYGVDLLRDQCLDTYWQSDGQLPHLVNIQFQKKTTISTIYIYTDYKLDESYTPNKISIRIGTNFNDLEEIELIDVQEPTGWMKIILNDVCDKPIRTFMIQIAVIANHQNGRDTHMRQIRIHSPVNMGKNLIGNFVSIGFQQHTCIR